MSGMGVLRSQDDATQFVGGQKYVWVRVAGTADQDCNWTVEALELVCGTAPAGWQRTLRRYPRALLAAIEATGPVVAEWLQRSVVTIEGETLALPQLYGNPSWERSASSAPTAFAALEWPVLEARLGQPVGRVASNDPLIAEGEPSFRSFYIGAASLFGLALGPNESLHQGIMLRYQDTRGRLAAVRVGRDEITIKVDGDATSGMTVELAANDPGPSMVLDGTVDCDVHFGLVDGLPQGAWVVLKLGSEWIDRRFLSAPWQRGPEPGVEFVPLGTKLQVFLANREGQDVEFKERLPIGRENPKAVMKTACAFANGAGGSILFGVDDDLVAIGLQESTMEAARARLTDLIYGWVQPTPTFGFQTLPIEGSDAVVLELRVEAGAGLFTCGTPSQATTVYVRHGAKTVPARVHEIERIVQIRTQSSVRVRGL